MLIKWEDLQFPEHWVVTHTRPHVPRNITTTNITENSSSAVISFPRRSTIDRKRIDAACKSSKYYKDPSTVDIACSSFSFCRHNQLYELAQLVNFSSLEVKCPDCFEVINLLTLAERNIHLHHNPRTGIAPPSTSISSCLNPKCSDIPFPHEPEPDCDHALVIHIVEEEDPRITEMIYLMRPAKLRYGLGKLEQSELIPECRFKEIPYDCKKPVVMEMHKFFALMDGCLKSEISSKWMKEMLNWDLYTNPQA